MKRIALLVCAGVLAVGVPLAAADTGNTHRDSNKRERADKKGCRSDEVCGLDKEWLKTSMEGDLFEVRGGKMAQSKSNNPAVLRLAARLIKDHSQSYEEAAALARKLGVEVPTDPSPTQQWELQVVSRMNGAQFNHWYSSLEVQDHIQDIQETSDEAKDGCNHAVRDMAKDEIPVLRTHLQLAQQALQANP